MRLADLDPVIVGILEIRLPHAVAAVVERVHLARQVAVAHALRAQIFQRRVEMRRRQAEVVADRAIGRGVAGAADQMDFAVAVESEPADRRPPRLVLDLLQTQQFAVERGALGEIADHERKMVDAEFGAHIDPPLSRAFCPRAAHRPAPLPARPRGATIAPMLELAACPELLTPREMGEADRFAIRAGVPGLVLMERAGLAVAREAARLARTRGRIVVLCGPGGNGGDGFVAARYLAGWGYPTQVYLLGEKSALREDAAEMAARWSGGVHAAEAFSTDGADLVIDALYGAGLSRDVDGLAADCIARINA